MEILERTSDSFNELLQYVQFAFPEKSSALDKTNTLVAFIERKEQDFKTLYNKLVANISNSFLTEEECHYSCNCKAMCIVYNAISIELEY